MEQKASVPEAAALFSSLGGAQTIILIDWGCARLFSAEAGIGPAVWLARGVQLSPRSKPGPPQQPQLAAGGKGLLRSPQIRIVLRPRLRHPGTRAPPVRTTCLPT